MCLWCLRALLASPAFVFGRFVFISLLVYLQCSDGGVLWRLSRAGGLAGGPGGGSLFTGVLLCGSVGSFSFLLALEWVSALVFAFFALFSGDELFRGELFLGGGG